MSASFNKLCGPVRLKDKLRDFHFHFLFTLLFHFHFLPQPVESNYISIESIFPIENVFSQLFLMYHGKYMKMSLSISIFMRNGPIFVRGAPNQPLLEFAVSRFPLLLISFFVHLPISDAKTHGTYSHQPAKPGQSLGCAMSVFLF